MRDIFGNTLDIGGAKNVSHDTDTQVTLPKITRDQLITLQGKDVEIQNLSKLSVTEEESVDLPVCYFQKSGILMRKWRPLDSPAEQEWQMRTQIVAPPEIRSSVLSVAHDSGLSGHLGVSKTYDRISRHFYWPRMRKDISKFCRSCHKCQIVGKPNQKIPKAPLKPIPAFEEPFTHVMVDCVGPLPKTRTGNQYLLTIMCASTRFPEAIPLRKITAQTVIKALIKFFTSYGLPKVVQSDQGSNFMSKLFKQVLQQLGIKHSTSSAYHPESQGALERFHQTLKTMLKTFCHESPKDWDDGVHLVLFALKEVVQESLGFSPFELVFGHQVRGPLKVFKDTLVTDRTATNLLDYVSSFKSKLLYARELAQKNLVKAQGKMKAWYDGKSRKRDFNPGDEVLVLFPVLGQTLQASYQGPFTIERKLNDVDYVIMTPGRRKSRQLCHVNMLKSYCRRESNSCKPVSLLSEPISNTNSIVDEAESCSFVDYTCKLTNSDILCNISKKLEHLNSDQEKDLIRLIKLYSSLFPDVPSRTNKIFHDVDVGDSSPIKQHPYRLNPLKLKQMKSETDYMLKHGIIECSFSAWSSPCILVPKSDGSYRFCTDFRKVNSVTKTDSYPIPRVDDCIDQVGNASFVTKFDLLKGYWQVPLTDRAKEISAFVTPYGFFNYTVTPFGMKNSPATFQRLINGVITGLEGCSAYIDDIVIASDSWEQHLSQIEAFFQRIQDANLTINLLKSEFGKATVIFLGYVVGQGKVCPVTAKVNAILEIPAPTNKQTLMRFLGMVGYYRKFCKNFAEITAPLTNLLKKSQSFVWTKECQDAFQLCKSMLSSEPVLRAPNVSKPFTLEVDASDIGAGAILLQEGSVGIMHPVCFYSKKFNKHQQNYSTIEKETLSLILALQHFEVYLHNSLHTITVYSDHNPLTFVSKMKNKNQRLMRWSLFLQEYNLVVLHIRGTDNVVADALSRV